MPGAPELGVPQNDRSSLGCERLQLCGGGHNGGKSCLHGR
jgi:hypothetical protein